ncbi:MAG: type II secretion system F family protein [Acidimicrobiales bacterium]
MPIEVYAAAGAVMLALPLVLYAAGAGEKFENHMGTGLSAFPSSAPTNMRDVRLQQRATDRVLVPMANALSGKVSRFTPTGAIRAMERKINVAGVASTWTVERLVATKLFFGVIGTALGLFLFFRGPSLKSLVLAVLLSAGSYIFPDMQLSHRAKDRAKLVERELPDMLDQMTIGVEAGLGFDAALLRVAQENEGPLAEEFGRMMQDRQLGMSREDAFTRIVDRTDCRDLKHFVLALTQADKHGMPLATVLRVQADEMRQKRRVRAEEKALSLPVKLVLPLVLCILPALFIVILGPAAFRLSEGGAV